MARERIREDWKQDLRIREQELRWICGTVAGSAGNKPGVKQASKIELFERTAADRPLPTVAQVMAMFGSETEEPRVILPGE